jgi:predicted ATPase
MAKAKAKKTSAPLRVEAAPDEESGISAVRVEGFKSIRKPTEIAIKPLTILAGANSSGKSSIMQPLLLMKQTLEAPSDPDVFLLDGPNVRFTSANQVVSRFGKVGDKRVVIRFRTISDRTMGVGYRKLPKGGFDITAMTETNQLGFGQTFRLGELHELTDGVAVPVRERCFLALRELRKPEDRSSSALGEKLMDPLAVRQVRDGLLSMIHVPAMHGNPERTYRATAAGPDFSGTFEPYVASIIHHWQITKDIRLRQLGVALQKLGLNWKVEAARVDDTRFELRVGRLKKKTTGGARDLVSIADVGFGVSQCLPVLVALLTARRGQLVYIEEPEMHLHPRAQVSLAQILADAANRGVRVVIETHSSLLLLGVQALVAEGALPPELVALHWFSLTNDGATEVRSADLDEAGAFGDWPEDFAEVTLDTQARYLDAAEKRLTKAKR